MGALYGESLDTASPIFARLTDDQAILAQWVLLVLSTDEGLLWSAPDSTIDVCSYVAKGMTPAVLAAIPADVSGVLTADQRIASADVTATSTYLSSGSAALKIVMVITPKRAGAAPFTLTALASAELVAITTQGL